MARSLNDTIREELQSKLDDAETKANLSESEIDPAILKNALESLLPDADWNIYNSESDRDKLIKLNANKLINNLNSQLTNES